jgi:hypothetical protein
MYQAGVKTITLFERKGVSYYFYDPTNANNITDLNNGGDKIIIENLQQPTFEITDIPLSDSGRTGYTCVVKFFLLGYTSTNKNIVKQIQESMYGWAVDVEFYDGTHKFFDVPFKCKEAKINPHKEMSFEIEMVNTVTTLVEHLDYTPGITIYSVFTFDSTLITFDSTLDTFDFVYEP